MDAVSSGRRRRRGAPARCGRAGAAGRPLPRLDAPSSGSPTRSSSRGRSAGCRARRRLRHRGRPLRGRRGADARRSRRPRPAGRGPMRRRSPSARAGADGRPDAARSRRRRARRAAARDPHPRPARCALPLHRRTTSASTSSDASRGTVAEGAAVEAELGTDPTEPHAQGVVLESIDVETLVRVFGQPRSDAAPMAGAGARGSCRKPGISAWTLFSKGDAMATIEKTVRSTRPLG